MHLWKVFVVVATIVALFAIGTNCTPSEGDDPDSGWANEPEEVAPACDPDGLAPCPDTMFICTEDAWGGKTCEEAAPMPDGGDWECVQMGTTLICRGDHYPDGGDWICEEDMETGDIFCRRHAYEPGTDGGGEGHWECEYAGEFRICEWVDDGGSGGDSDVDSDTDTDSDADADDDGSWLCPPGVEIPTDEICGDGVDNDCDGTVDETCPDYHPPSCICIPGAVRYCDTPDYCLWGTQVCNDDELTWSPCLEVRAIPSECSGGDGWYSPSAEACCVASGFCCQDMWDLDHNGNTWESIGDCVDILCVPEEDIPGE